MKSNLFAMGIFLTAILLTDPVSDFAMEDPGGQQGSPRMTPPKESSEDGPLSKDKELPRPKLTSPNPPIYKPPLRGAPGGRIGGGTRGIGDELISLDVLAPDHIALTVQDQPTLYWYLSKLPQRPLEFRIIEDQSTRPILKTQIPIPTHAGIHPIRLADYQVRLLPGRTYWWFVAVVRDADHRSQDIFAGGLVKHIELPETLRAKLARAHKNELFQIYAEESIWYDAVAAISDMIEAEPNDMRLRKQRASLMEQVGLSEVAGYDLGQEAPGKNR
jgi:hypothetical protein